MSQIKNLLAPLNSNKLEQLDVNKVLETLRGNEPKLGEYVQYVIYEYCNKNCKESTERVQKIRRLTTACYTSPCVEALVRPVSFTGCLATIHKYFTINGDEATAALLLRALNDFTEKFDDECSGNLFLLFNSTIDVAEAQASSKPANCLHLLLDSLTAIKFIKAPNTRIAGHIARKIRNIGNKLPDYKERNVVVFFKEGKKQMDRLCESQTYAVEEYLSKRLCSIVESANVVASADTYQAVLDVYLRVSNWSRDTHPAFQRFAQTVFDSKSSVQKGLESVKAILSGANIKELGRACAILCSAMSDGVWCALRGDKADSSTVQDVTDIYNLFFLPLVDVLSALRLDNGVVEGMMKLCALVTHLCRECFKHVGGAESMELVPILTHAIRVGRDAATQLPASSVATYYWSNIARRAVNAVENLLLHCQRVKGDWCHLQAVCEVLLGPPDPKLDIDAHRLPILYDRWARSLQSQNKLEQAMLVRALEICRCPSNLDIAIGSWLTIKMSLPQHHKLKEMPISCYLSTINAKLKVEFGADVSSVAVKEALLSELSAYRSVAMPSNSSQPQAVHVQMGGCMSVFRELEAQNATVGDLVLGLMRLVMVVIADVNPQELQNIINYCHKTRKMLIQSKESVGDAYCVYEGTLQFALFLCCGQQSSQRNELPAETRGLLLTQLKTEAADKVKYGEAVDMSVACDLDPLAESLVLEDEVRRLQALDAALTPFLQLAIDVKLSSEEQQLTLDCLCAIANSASLLGDVAMSAAAWARVYFIANKHTNLQVELLAISKLVVCCGVEPESSIIQLGVDCARPLANATNKPQPILVAHLSFLLAYASSCVSSNQPQKAVELLSEFQKEMGSVKAVPDLYMLKGRFICLASQLLVMGVPYGQQPPNVQYLAIEAFKYLKIALNPDYADAVSVSSREDLLLASLDVILWCSDVMMSLLLTPYVRALVEDMYAICQKLGLVARTAQLLSVLTAVDLLTHHTDDSTHKINNLSAMLALSHVVPLKSSELDGKSRDVGLEVCTKSSAYLSPTRCLQPPRSRSPLGDMLPFSSDRSHPDKCACRACSLPLVQLIRADAWTHRGMLAALQGDSKLALSYIKHALSGLPQDPQQWHRPLTHHLRHITTNINPRCFTREATRVKLTTTIKYVQCLLQTGPNTAKQVAEELGRCQQWLPLVSPAHQALLQFHLLELHICLWANTQRIKPVVHPFVTLDAPKSVVPKTPRTVRKRAGDVGTGTMARAPAKPITIDIDVPASVSTPPARRGRRIFKTPPNANQPQPSKKTVAFAESTEPERPTASKSSTVASKTPRSELTDKKSSRKTDKVARVKPISIDLDSCTSAETPQAKTDRCIFSTPPDSPQSSQLKKAVAFAETSLSEKPQTRKADALKTPKSVVSERRSTRKKGKENDSVKPEAFVAASIQVTKQRPAVVPESDEDEDIAATPSPVTRSGYRLPLSQVRPRRQVARVARPLIFDESRQAASADGDLSPDLFESFEQKLKITQSTEKKDRKKKEPKRVDVAVTVRKAPRL